MGLGVKAKQGIKCMFVFMEIVVAAVWIIQLILVLSYRFSHTGKVCAGDYAELEII